MSKLIDGEVATDWIELAPSKEWGDLAQGYFVGLVAINGTATFDRVSVVQVPEMDISDVHTGFEAVWRYYNWSGFGGEALVVSFGDLFPFRNDDRKFIFWDQANYVPAWHFNNEMQFSYGFNETWGGGSVGCFEPMSDRLLRYAKVKLIEDNPVRKVIHWEYVLIDPDYKVPDNEKGTQLPEVDEYYMIYADGSIIRKIRYTPKLDTDFRNWHELTELIIIGGGNNRPGSLVDKPALSVYEIGRSNKQFHPLGQIDFENNYKMGATAMIAHLKNAPDAFNAFADDSYFSETYGGYQLNYKIDWHNINLNFSHWPINKEPYMEPHKSWSAWPEQISHTSLIGMGVYGGTDWDDHYMEDEEGRRYREWLSLEGLSEHRNYEQTADKVNSWLFRGNVTMTNDSATYLSYSLSDKWFEFNAEKWKPACYVQIDPYRALVNPVLKINNWSSGNVVVNVNKKTLENDEYIAYIDSDNSLYILLNGDYSDGLEAKISTSDILVSVSEKKTGTNTPKVSPNPVTSGSLNVDLEDNIPEAHITLYDLSGRAVFKTVVNDKSTIIGTEPYHTGTYLLEIRSGNEIYRKKVIILDH